MTTYISFEPDKHPTGLESANELGSCSNNGQSPKKAAKFAAARPPEQLDLASLTARQDDLGKRLMADAALWQEMEPQFLSQGDVAAAHRARARAQAYSRCAELIMALRRGAGHADERNRPR